MLVASVLPFVLHGCSIPLQETRGRGVVRVSVRLWPRSGADLRRGRKGNAMVDRLGGLGVLALVFVVGCVVAAVYKGSVFPAIVAIPGMIYLIVRLFATPST